MIAQRPRAGAELRRGMAVGLVSKGAAPGPHGVLRADGIGRLSVGASTRAAPLFGRPDRRATRNLGVGPAPEIDWTWRLGRDEVELHFDARRRTLTGYCTDSPRLSPRTASASER